MGIFGDGEAIAGAIASGNQTIKKLMAVIESNTAQLVGLNERLVALEEAIGTMQDEAAVWVDRLEQAVNRDGQ